MFRCLDLLIKNPILKTMKQKLFLFISWLLLVGIGSFSVYEYSNKAGPVGHIPQKWPSQSLLPKPKGLPTLLLFVHPKCSCTRASLSELAIVLTKARNLVNTMVVFYKPQKFNNAWVESDLWNYAKKLPQTKVIIDPEGKEAQKYGAKTSGQTILYGEEGKLLFAGGITISRAHEGDNLGRASLIDILLGKKIKTKMTETFGCNLFHKSTQKSSELMVGKGHKESHKRGP